MLQLARLDYERGDFAQAAAGFSTILSSPVRLDTRQALHEGFLYYAFTLFLQGGQGSRESAKEKLNFALRLDPDFVPSPVTTRPDLLNFYTEERNAFVLQNGTIAEPPEIVFPELQRGRETTRVMQRRRFVPVFGRGLHFLGHRKAGAAVLGTELGLAGINLATFVLRLALIEDVTPAGWEATRIARYANYISFGLFWGTFTVDLVVSLILRQRYRLRPEAQPTQKASLPPRQRLLGPRLAIGQGGLGLAFW